MKILVFLTIFLVFTGRTQLDVNPEEGTKSNEPHYVDGRHNPQHEHSEKELEDHKEIFDTYDLNKDGLIDPQEIRESLNGVTDAELTELFDFADRDQDGAINFDEYLINAFDYVEGEDANAHDHDHEHEQETPKEEV